MQITVAVVAALAGLGAIGVRLVEVYTAPNSPAAPVVTQIAGWIVICAAVVSVGLSVVNAVWVRRRVVEASTWLEAAETENTGLKKQLKEEALQRRGAADQNKELIGLVEKHRRNFEPWSLQMADSRKVFFSCGGGITVEEAAVSVSSERLRLVFRNYGVARGTVGALAFQKVVGNGIHTILNDNFRLRPPLHAAFGLGDAVEYAGRVDGLAAALRDAPQPVTELSIGAISFSFTENGQRESVTIFMPARNVRIDA
ncbi:MAG: hypothetical protein V4850_23645 [Myxococcota bacterium]